MNYKKSIFVFRCGVLLSAGLGLTAFAVRVTVLGLFSLVTVLLSILQLIAFYNCPNCGKGLPIHNHKRCPFCGFRFY